MEFLKSCLLVGLLVIIQNACGDVICSSGDSPFSELKSCDFGCCGERNAECCIDHTNRNEPDYDEFILAAVSVLLLPCALLLLLLLVVCGLVSCCCCWYFKLKRRRNNQGVVYSQAATMDGTGTINFPLNKVIHIFQPNQNQTIPPYGISSPVYNETTQMFSSSGSPSAPDDDQLQLIKSEA